MYRLLATEFRLCDKQHLLCLSFWERWRCETLTQRARSFDSTSFRSGWHAHVGREPACSHKIVRIHTGAPPTNLNRPIACHSERSRTILKTILVNGSLFIFVGAFFKRPLWRTQFVPANLNKPIACHSERSRRILKPLLIISPWCDKIKKTKLIEYFIVLRPRGYYIFFRTKYTCWIW